jgi:hypothetical protein
MAELENGTLVQHTTLGVGKIVAVEANAVHVFFPDNDRRFAAKLRLPAARPMLRTEGFERDSWLEGLSAFSLDPTVGRYGLAASWLTHDEAIAQFLAMFPKGFEVAQGGEGKARRTAQWRAAREAWAAAFGKGEAERLATDGDFAELVKRALKVERLVAALHPPADADAAKEAFADGEATRAFFVALLELLSVPSPGRARFEKLFAAAVALPIEPAQQWVVATLFPFLASPERHVLLRPKVTCEAAERLGCDLRWDASPNWATYSALRTLSTQLLEKLKPHGAKDFVDVESFLHVTGTAKRQPTKADGAASKSKPRGGAREVRPRTNARRTP